MRSPPVRFVSPIIPAEPRDVHVERDEDWRALLRTGANVLVVGPRAALDAFLAAADGDLRQPVYVVPPCGDIPTKHPGTLVLVDAGRLTASQQTRLLVWLDDCTAQRPQVISLSERHVWDAEHPAVLLDLYYRLNTICLELST